MPQISIMKDHHYHTNLTWTGNTGEGTKTYRSYERSHVINIDGKPAILGSSDANFRGDPSMHTPEDMLLASISACHMLWYLHLCTTAGIIVSAYEDKAEGIMVENADGSGHFTQVTLKPTITIQSEDLVSKANELHHHANKLCFIAQSVNFPVLHEASYEIAVAS